MPNLKSLSFATFNLYNLNEPGLPIYTGDGWSVEEYNKKLGWTSFSIGMLEADVFGFQELWHTRSLENVFAQSTLRDQYDLLAPPNHNGKRIACVAAVRKGLLEGEAEWITDFPDELVLKSEGDDPQTPRIGVNIKKFSRPVLHFRIKPRSNRSPVHVFVCHFKSKGPTKIFRESWYDREIHSQHRSGIGSALSTIRRTAEAAALRVILTKLMAGNDHPVIVLGDINDGQLSNTVNIVTDQPRYLHGLSKGGTDRGLYTGQTLQEYRSMRDVYYTHVYENVRESLDHILVSEQFYDNSRNRVWAFDGMDVNNDHLNFEDHKALGTNDHGIIRCRFKYAPAKSRQATS